MAVIAEGTATEGQRLARHPLEPLTGAEIARATAALRHDTGFPAGGRIVTVELVEPPKAEVLAWKPGDGSDARRAKVVVRVPAAKATHEAVVTLGGEEALVTWQQMGPVQPMLMLEEFYRASEVVREDPAWQAAMRRRGVTDFSLAMFAPWPVGHFHDGDDAGKGRFLRMLTWIKSFPGDNGHAHPVEGVAVRLDLDEMAVLGVEDDGVVPIPAALGNFTPEGIAGEANSPRYPDGARSDVRALEIVQPDGPSFEVDGYHITWQRWDLRVGFTAREGLVLYLVSYDDRGRRRPVLYRGSLSEMFVPYGDRASTHWPKNVFDEGEYGLGFLTNSLELGCDCLGEIRYLDGVVNDNDGNPVVVHNAICLHEEDFGILWKHAEPGGDGAEVRRSRRFVVSSIATVGNYDYAFYWYLYQDGSIEYEVKLTGILSTGAVAPGEVPSHGRLVAPGLYGPNHHHFFNVRLDMMVDGTENVVSEVNVVPAPPGPGNPSGTVWAAEETVLASELAARRDVDPARGRYWRIANRGAENRFGQPTAYRLVPGANTAHCYQDGSPALERASFVRHHFWATAFDPEERYASGDYPNQAAGGGLAAYGAEDRSLVDADVVVWYTLGAAHIPRPEDWPVLPVHRLGFRLEPEGFFDGNPSIDLPRPTHCHAEGGAGGTAVAGE